MSTAKKRCEDAEAETASVNDKLAESKKRISELEAQIAELAPFKAEVETLKAEKAAAELVAKQKELTEFAEAQGLDVKAEAVAAAIQSVNYEVLISEAMKQGKKSESKPTVASYAMTGGMPMTGEYGDLLGKA